MVCRVKIVISLSACLIYEGQAVTDKKRTVGDYAQELQQKTPDSRDPIELQREMQKDFEANIFQAVLDGKRKYFTNFFVIVITKKERLMHNVLRNYFTTRTSCPTPDYDQAVYFYNRTDDSIEFLWVLPSKDTCELLRDHALEVVPAERELRDFVLSFYDDTLLHKAKQYNNEQKRSPLLEK